MVENKEVVVEHGWKIEEGESRVKSFLIDGRARPFNVTDKAHEFFDPPFSPPITWSLPRIGFWFGSERFFRRAIDRPGESEG